MNLGTILKELKERLPELEWQLSKPEFIFRRKSIPRGLFRTPTTTTTAFVEEIKNDIERLQTQSEPQIAHYLAGRIHQKINFLVRLCCTNRAHESQSPPKLTLDALSTRQQWLQNLELRIHELSKQHEALEIAWRQKRPASSDAQLALQEELGIAQRRLQEAKEAFERAMR